MYSKRYQLVNSSWTLVKADTHRVAELFYQRLFKINPALKKIFPPPMDLQYAKLMAAISIAVKNLERPEIIEEYINGLGRRHNQYGAQPIHFEQMGSALIWALKEILGTEFDAEVQQAWQETYDMISEKMCAQLCVVEQPKKRWGLF